MKIAKI